MFSNHIKNITHQIIHLSTNHPHQSPFFLVIRFMHVSPSLQPSRYSQLFHACTSCFRPLSLFILLISIHNHLPNLQPAHHFPSLLHSHKYYLSSVPYHDPINLQQQQQQQPLQIKPSPTIMTFLTSTSLPSSSRLTTTQTLDQLSLDSKALRQLHYVNPLPQRQYRRMIKAYKQRMKEEKRAQSRLQRACKRYEHQQQYAQKMEQRSQRLQQFLSEAHFVYPLDSKRVRIKIWAIKIGIL